VQHVPDPGTFQSTNQIRGINVWFIPSVQPQPELGASLSVLFIYHFLLILG